GQVVVDPAAITGLAPPSGFKSAIKSWMGVPLVIGQRVIGLAAFVVFRPKGFTSGDLRRAHELARYIAPVVENAVAFAEAERHLQRQALLNELASAASVSTDVESVARRVLRMLRRTFHTNRAGLLLLAADGETLQAYGADKRRKMPPLDSALSGHVIRSGMPVRVGEAGETPVENLPEHVRSALAVPLKYRGNIIGVLGLESDTPNAFSQQDEQLIMVITSHLAGLIENIHLNEETRERAHNLSAIHQVVQQIVGLVDVSEIAQVAADLTAERFGYDLVLVLLMSETSETLAVQGVGGADAHPVKIGAQFSVHEELVGDVLRTGASALIQNTDTLVCLPIPGRGAGSQMCVPLREGDQIFGVVAVDRLPKGGVNENDLLVLESLAGVLSSVLMNARRYNQLQERIEAQKLAEKRLVQSARLAAVGEMAASVAHELNNPLTTIAGFTELVLDDMGEDAIQREDLELVLREARRARGVVRRLLDFSRQGDHMKSPVDINEILGEVLALVHHLARATGVEVRFVPWDDLPVIRMDRGQMKQVVLNLVHNALQAMPHGGALVLQTTSEQREDKNWIALQVLDTGEGIPDDIINRIFEPFFTTKPVGSGTGLGLSISYNIVSDHGGFMEVESQAGKGSCFTIWLPAENGAQSHGRDDAQ
ncbi:MAG: GAF domain-containing protein, partial [Anaerolineales bacterium]